MSMHRLLCVFAHPDDECYGPGGTIARCALDGADVFLTMFTAGEAGSIGISKTLPRDELASRRRRELALACDALGVRAHRILGAPDGGVAGVDAGWAVGEILADIRRYQPHVTLTFHRRGVSGHPDHIAVAHFLDQAIAAAGADGPRASYEWGIPRAKTPLYQRPSLVPLEEDEIAAVVAVEGEAMDRKVEAIRCHQTQYEFFVSLENKFDYRAVSSPEHFARAPARLRFDGRPVTDVFEGIGED
jgi:LmbE family N-acetylglucosaminyl deacetylase